MRLSVTTLELFNRFINGDMTKTELIERLTTKFEGNIYTERGTSFHALIENYDKTDYCYNDYTFDKMQIDDFVKDIQDFKENGISEVKGIKEYEIGGETIQLIGKADYYNGNSILELKTTAYYNAESYEDSVQWRAYMIIFGANEVIYKVATIEDNDKKINIKKVDTLVKTYYEGIDYEVYSLIHMFLEFIKVNNICLVH